MSHIIIMTFQILWHLLFRQRWKAMRSAFENRINSPSYTFETRLVCFPSELSCSFCEFDVQLCSGLWIVSCMYSEAEAETEREREREREREKDPNKHHWYHLWTYNTSKFKLVKRRPRYRRRQVILVRCTIAHLFMIILIKTYEARCDMSLLVSIVVLDVVCAVGVHSSDMARKKHSGSSESLVEPVNSVSYVIDDWGERGFAVFTWVHVVIGHLFKFDRCWFSVTRLLTFIIINPALHDCTPLCRQDHCLECRFALALSTMHTAFTIYQLVSEGIYPQRYIKACNVFMYACMYI